MILKSVCSFFFCFIVYVTAKSQTTITIGTGTALTADHHSGPIYRSSAASTYDYCQFAYLYTAAELGAIPTGAVISKIAWNKTSTGATVGGAKFKVYIKSSAATGYTLATPFSTLINGATLVYSSSNTTIPATTGFIEFVFTTPFTYNGGGIEIMTDWDISSLSGDPATGAFSWQKTTVESKILGYADGAPITAALSPTTNSIGTLTNTRPVVQLTFNGTLTPCTGIPSGGQVTGPDSVCTAANFTLDVSGSTAGVSGLGYQWQSSSDSIGWVDLAGAVTDAVSVSQSATTYYRRIIYCGTNADTAVARRVKVKQISQCYCKPPGTNCSLNDVITNVSFASLQHASGCSSGGYIDYSDSVSAPVIYQSTSVPIAVTVGPGGVEYVAVWIDYNHNGSFDDNEYTSVGFGNGITINGAIDIPTGFPPGLTKMRVRVRYNAALNSTNSCTAYSYGETEDYLVNILSSIPCSGMPAGGTTITSSSFVCILDSTLLSVNNATTGVSGLTYQWQSSRDSITWEDIPGKVNATASVSQDSIRFYRRSIGCGVNVNYAEPVKVLMQAPTLCYCRPDSSGCSVSGNITYVYFAGIGNQSSCTPRGYSNYGGAVPPATVQAGVTLPITVSTYSASNSLTTYFYVWIDYDHSGTFDSTEYSFLGTIQGPGTVAGAIYIPVNAVTGITGMRVRAKFNLTPTVTALDACTTLPTSETEDYFVNIKAASSCLNNLTAGIISGPVDVCPNFPFTLTNINATDGNIRYAWQSSADTISWANINNTGSLLRNIEVAQTATTYYRLVDSCSLYINAISNTIKVAMKSNPLFCHCIPPGSSVCTIGDIIGRVIFGTIDTSTYCSPDGYSDFINSNQTTAVTANTAKSMSVQVGCSNGNPEWVGVWIDFNQDGIFERSEFSLLGFGCGSTITGNISIPTNALEGNTRMRVRVTADGRFTPSDACTHFANGETEDYKVSVIAYPACPVNTWTGSVNSVWENPANWSCGMVPGLYSNVVLNSGNAIISSNVTVYSLNVNPAATLTIVPPFNLVITH